MIAAFRDLAARVAASWRRQETAFRLVTFGRAELESSPHEPWPDEAWPGVCAIDGLDLDDPLHQRRYRGRRARRGAGGVAAERGWG